MKQLIILLLVCFVGVRYKDSMNRVLKPVKKFFIKEGVMYAQFDEGHGNNDGCLGINSLQILSSQPTPTQPVVEQLTKVDMPETKYMNTVEAYNEGFTMGVRHCEKYGIPSHKKST